MPTDFPSGTTGISRVYSSIQEKVHRPALRSPFEAGYAQTRSKWTATKREFAISWKGMSNASHTSLTTFFSTTVVGGSLSWIWNNPLSGTTFEVRFLDDSIDFSNDTKSQWSGSIKVMEV